MVVVSMVGLPLPVLAARDPYRPPAKVDIVAVIRSCTAYPEPPRPLLAGNLLAKHSPVECGGIVPILTSEGFQWAPERFHSSIRWIRLCRRGLRPIYGKQPSQLFAWKYGKIFLQRPGLWYMKP
jgi:hypothetical protein